MSEQRPGEQAAAVDERVSDAIAAWADWIYPLDVVDRDRERMGEILADFERAVRADEAEKIAAEIKALASPSWDRHAQGWNHALRHLTAVLAARGSSGEPTG